MLKSNQSVSIHVNTDQTVSIHVNTEETTEARVGTSLNRRPRNYNAICQGERSDHNVDNGEVGRETERH